MDIIETQILESLRTAKANTQAKLDDVNTPDDERDFWWRVFDQIVHDIGRYEVAAEESALIYNKRNGTFSVRKILDRDQARAVHSMILASNNVGGDFDFRTGDRGRIHVNYKGYDTVTGRISITVDAREESFTDDVDFSKYYNV